MGDAVSESDSGCGNLRRDALMSATAHSSSDASNQVTQDEGVASVGPARTGGTSVSYSYIKH